VKGGRALRELIIDHEGKLKERITDKVISEIKLSEIQSYEKKTLKDGTKKITIYYGGEQ